MMGKYQFTPPEKDLPLPGLELEEQVLKHLEDASECARWDRVTGRPEDATTEHGGLMTAEDKQTLQDVDAAVKHLDSFHNDGLVSVPDWQLSPAGFTRSATGWRTSGKFVFPPDYLEITIAASAYYCRNHPAFSINAPENWDNVVFANPVMRQGKDFFIHFVAFSDDTESLVLSVYAATPSLNDIAASRLIGGFHCLCMDVGTIPDHPLSGFVTGDIIPMSMWDLWHHAAAKPAVMVFDPAIGLWIDIYLPTEDGVAGFAVPVYSGDDRPAMQRIAIAQNKRLLTDEQSAAALAGTSTETIATPETAGGNADTSGRRVISHTGLEDKGGYRFCALPGR